MTSRSAQIMYPHGRAQAPPLVPGHAGMKFTVLETLDHIKEEFQLFQAQYHSLKLECEKLANEKSEMHRHYVMYYEMSYGLNIEMQKQAEIVKRLSAICTQILPLLSQEHQHQVAQAVERSKHVSMADLNAIIGQLQHLSQHASAFPLTPHPSGLALSTGAGLVALPGAFPFPPHLPPKDDITRPESVDPRDGAPHRSFPDAALMSQPLGQRLSSSLACPTEPETDSKRSSVEEKTQVPTPRDSEVNKNSLRGDAHKESASPVGNIARPLDGNGLDGSPVLRRSPSREAPSPASPYTHPRTPGRRRTPPQEEKTHSPSRSPSRGALSPSSSPAPPTGHPRASPARAPSPPVQH
ncbi:TLE family member 2, transcriptional corepressor c isoform X2 [Brachyhypopomus gauderio]|uniref:TLE family member 2, transcriptional corepressor c isoform X2 n=1 Tax=Brachyhypopomus gauderio TaxID=698409 RepID=UPI0040432F24